MKRGDLVTVSLPGAYGKPRPAVVIQSDYFTEHSSVTLLPITSSIIDGAPFLRIDLKPEQGNGLNRPSQVMIDKAHTLPRDKVGTPFGVLDEQDMLAVTRALAVFLGIA